MEVVVVNFRDFKVLVVLIMDLIHLNNLKVSLKILEWIMKMILGFSLEEVEAKKIVITPKEVPLDLEVLGVLEVLMMTL